MGTPADNATNAGVPAVLAISSGIWLVLGAAGTLWTLMGLLMILAFGGMVGPQTYLPALELYLGSGAVFVSGVLFSVFLRRGRRLARVVLSAFAVAFSVFLYYPYLPGGPSAVEVPWQVALISPVGAAVVAAVIATVLMWLPPANAYFARGGAPTPGTPAGSEAASGRVPQTVTAAVWILAVSGAIAALEAVLGLLVLSGSTGSDRNLTPALVLYLTLAAVAVGYLACARAVRRGKPFVRPVAAVIPLVGLGLVVLASIAAFSSASAVSPAAAGGLPAAILLAVLSQGLPIIGGLAAAVLIWLPPARGYFRRGAEVLPAGTSGS
ncbi:MAG TPA: hypothetical protein VLR70_03555 [Arthrobacter sp.]|nr:hypothetical protein [Arthrobacter sp.]